MLPKSEFASLEKRLQMLILSSLYYNIYLGVIMKVVSANILQL